LKNAYAYVQVEEEEKDGPISEGAGGPNPGGVGWDSVVTYRLPLASL